MHKSKVVSFVNALEEVAQCTADLFADYIPKDTMKHIRAARKERLLAVRSMIDSALDRVEGKEKAATRKKKSKKVKVE